MRIDGCKRNSLGPWTRARPRAKAVSSLPVAAAFEHLNGLFGFFVCLGFGFVWFGVFFLPEESSRDLEVKFLKMHQKARENLRHLSCV